MFSSFQLSLKSLFLRPKRRRAIRSIQRSKKVYQNDTTLKLVWDTLITRFFPTRTDLLTYTVNWSARRQKRTLGSCNLNRRHVSIAIELQHTDYAEWIEPLMHHELCHAVLGVEVRRARGKRAWHGEDFKKLESLHPQTKSLNAWVQQGGFSTAVRRHRAKLAAAARHGSTYNSSLRAANE